MSFIGVVNRSTLDDRDVAFFAEAWNQQAREVAAAHSALYTPVVFYGQAEGTPPGDCRVLTILPTIDVPGALGFHDDDLGVIFAQIKGDGSASTTGSHEVAEELVDPTVDRWMPFDVDHEQAYEVSDRVERDSYLQAATVLGETRQVPVSNYLLPSAFRPDGLAPFDRMGLLRTWNGMTPGGYYVARFITTGKVSDVFARRAPEVIVSGPAAGAVVAAKMALPGSRLSRRLRG